MTRNVSTLLTAMLIAVVMSLVLGNCGPRISKDDLRFSRIYIETAQSHFMKGNFAKAEFEARRALELTPEDPEANRILALSAFKLRKLAVALQHIKKAIELDPKNGDYHNDLGGFYQYEQKYQHALVEFKLALEDKGFRAPAATLFNIAETYRLMNNAASAREYYQKSLELDPNQDRPYYQLALLIKESGDTEQAITLFEEGLKVNQGNYMILQELCLHYCKNKSEKGVKRYCTLFLNAVPENFDDPYAIDRARRCVYDFE